MSYQLAEQVKVSLTEHFLSPCHCNFGDEIQFGVPVNKGEFRVELNRKKTVRASGIDNFAVTNA
jgi:hypothetical protein